MRTLIITALLCATSVATAQRNLEVGIGSGVTHFFGDLGNVDAAVQMGSMRPGVQVTFRDFLNNPKRYVTRSLTTEARLSWFRTGYDETAMIPGMDVSELRNYKRGLSFRNDLFGASGHIVLNAYRQPYQPLFQQRFFMYFHTGIGVYYGRPRADLFRGDIDMDNRYFFWNDGTVRDAPRGTPEELANVIEKDGKYETDLYDWVTESGQGKGENGSLKRKSPIHIAIPLGTGVRYMITKEVSLGIEFTYYMFTNDMVDDVSDRYATQDEILAAYPNDPERQQLARYISDPTGGWGTDGVANSPRTSRRGNPGLLDTMSFFSLEVSYKFKRKPSRRSFVGL